ncbi:hypothetical protein NUSPORA_01715 [Nucleospora cyclopteri]
MCSKKQKNNGLNVQNSDSENFRNEDLVKGHQFKEMSLKKAKLVSLNVLPSTSNEQEPISSLSKKEREKYLDSSDKEEIIQTVDEPIWDENDDNEEEVKEYNDNTINNNDNNINTTISNKNIETENRCKKIQIYKEIKKEENKSVAQLFIEKLCNSFYSKNKAEIVPIIKEEKQLQFTAEISFFGEQIASINSKIGQFDRFKDEMTMIKTTVSDLKDYINDLRKEIDQKNKRIDRLNHSYLKEMERIKQNFATSEQQKNTSNLEIKSPLKHTWENENHIKYEDFSYKKYKQK